MSAFDQKNTENTQRPGVQTIDLQGVAAFAGLVELLANELGTTPGRLLGHLPNGPVFNELVGEIDKNGQGYLRRITMVAKPGSPLTFRLQSAWNEKRNNDTMLGVTADFYVAASVEQIQPQGRALARHIEDLFAVLDRMVTLGQSVKLANVSISAADLQAFEASQSSLVSPSSTKPQSFAP